MITKYFLGYTPLLVYVLAINLFTFFYFGLDKLYARARAWRVREATLLILALLGGSPGAILGIKLFRHKTKKPGFLVALALILLGQLLFWWWYQQWVGAGSAPVIPTVS